jgi:hypothetical protein
VYRITIEIFSLLRTLFIRHCIKSFPDTRHPHGGDPPPSLTVPLETKGWGGPVPDPHTLAEPAGLDPSGANRLPGLHHLYCRRSVPTVQFSDSDSQHVTVILTPLFAPTRRVRLFRYAGRPSCSDRPSRRIALPSLRLVGLRSPRCVSPDCAPLVASRRIAPLSFEPTVTVNSHSLSVSCGSTGRERSPGTD